MASTYEGGDSGAFAKQISAIARKQRTRAWGKAHESEDFFPQDLPSTL